jgi:triosephosphate isomerase
MHQFIRNLLAQKYGKTAADGVRILYGGSCKPSNAAELFAQPDVDGALVGGAALQASDFLSIIKARKTASSTP